ncbi:MAG: hypothetical protein PHC45_10775 [Clostridiaceae bacterium]|nr:hypothetical protein [Clostridiaceae bacterium]
MKLKRSISMLLITCIFIAVSLSGTTVAAASGTKIPGAFWALSTQ